MPGRARLNARSGNDRTKGDRRAPWNAFVVLTALLGLGQPVCADDAVQAPSLYLREGQAVYYGFRGSAPPELVSSRKEVAVCRANFSEGVVHTKELELVAISHLLGWELSKPEVFERSIDYDITAGTRNPFKTAKLGFVPEWPDVGFEFFFLPSMLTPIKEHLGTEHTVHLLTGEQTEPRFEGAGLYRAKSTGKDVFSVGGSLALVSHDKRFAISGFYNTTVRVEPLHFEEMHGQYSITVSPATGFLDDPKRSTDLADRLRRFDKLVGSYQFSMIECRSFDDHKSTIPRELMQRVPENWITGD